MRAAGRRGVPGRGLAASGASGRGTGLRVTPSAGTVPSAGDLHRVPPDRRHKVETRREIGTVGAACLVEKTLPHPLRLHEDVIGARQHRPPGPAEFPPRRVLELLLGADPQHERHAEAVLRLRRQVAGNERLVAENHVEVAAVLPEQPEKRERLARKPERSEIEERAADEPVAVHRLGDRRAAEAPGEHGHLVAERQALRHLQGLPLGSGQRKRRRGVHENADPQGETTFGSAGLSAPRIIVTPNPSAGPPSSIRRRKRSTARALPRRIATL